MKPLKPILLVFLIAFSACNNSGNRTGKHDDILPANLFEYSDNLDPRWVSFENPTGEKGKGGLENNGAKGHPSDHIIAGETKTLLDIEGPGIINRIWITIRDRSPQMLRSLVVKMYWDNEENPAVSVPFGDFFGVGLGKTAVFENALFANPEGRSFNCYIPMPFKTGARVEITNESDIDLTHIFYDIDLQLMKNWDDQYLYFHCFWHRDTATTLAEDFEILPEINGKGRFLGTNISVVANPDYVESWWGEGEVKIYLNGDDEFPTLVGTGTEDYIGTAWGQGKFCNKYTGCLIADNDNLQWAFYRYHIPDPVYFKTDCRVTIQQMGGKKKEKVIAFLKEGVDLIPVTVNDYPFLRHIYRKDGNTDLEDPDLPNTWTNYYRSDDVAAACYFYLDKPVNELPEMQSPEVRTWNLN